MVRSWVYSFGTLELWGAAKVPKLNKPMSPEWLWSGHGVCSLVFLELWNFKEPPKEQNCTTLCPQGGYGQGMWSGGPPKVPKFKKCTNLCPQSGYGQGTGSAVLELWNFGGL